MADLTQLPFVAGVLDLPLGLTVTPTHALVAIVVRGEVDGPPAVPAVLS